MTDIDKMTPDELRIAIAKAKGWKTETFHTFSSSGRVVGTAPDGKFFDTVPNWPADIAAAWELVEEVGAKNWTVTIENLADRPTEVLARIGIPFTLIWYTGFSDTAPLALCRAWLKLKETQ
jgi:hypothetical protein